MQQRLTPNFSLSDAFDMFMLDIQSRHLTVNTEKFYQSTLSPFIAWCKKQGMASLRDVTHIHLRTFLKELADRQLSSHTQHKYARAIKTFFLFCVSDELLEKSPSDKMRMPKLEQKVLKSFTQAEIKSILKACISERDAAICLALLDSGARASELCALDVQDIDLKTGAVTIRLGKGQKGRTTYIGAKARKQLMRYLLLRGKPQGGEPLFLSELTKKRLTVYGLTLVMRRLKQRSGVPEVTSHAFRRTFALEFLRGGGNIYVLAKLMGHASIDVLKRYLAITQDDLKGQHDRYAPGDNMT